jgi:hypothetical protein
MTLPDGTVADSDFVLTSFQFVFPQQDAIYIFYLSKGGRKVPCVNAAVSDLVPPKSPREGTSASK